MCIFKEKQCESVLTELACNIRPRLHFSVDVVKRWFLYNHTQIMNVFDFYTQTTKRVKNYIKNKLSK